MERSAPKGQRAATAAAIPPEVQVLKSAVFPAGANPPRQPLRGRYLSRDGDTHRPLNLKNSRSRARLTLLPSSFKLS